MRPLLVAAPATPPRADHVLLLRSNVRDLARSDRPATNSSIESGFAVHRGSKTSVGKAAPASSAPEEHWPAGVEQNRRPHVPARCAHRRDPASIAHSLASHQAVRMNEGSRERTRPGPRRRRTRPYRSYDGWRFFRVRLTNRTPSEEKTAAALSQDG